mmetsp:Transcript_28723/g.54246  ORF Transcript_28723/g.54246 Transcript_28723/m.54246 type:complete len:219 (-) Transcript_28723:539-1195(-)
MQNALDVTTPSQQELVHQSHQPRVLVWVQAHCVQLVALQLELSEALLHAHVLAHADGEARHRHFAVVREKLLQILAGHRLEPGVPNVHGVVRHGDDAGVDLLGRGHLPPLERDEPAQNHHQAHVQHPEVADGDCAEGVDVVLEGAVLGEGLHGHHKVLRRGFVRVPGRDGRADLVLVLRPGEVCTTRKYNIVAQLHNACCRAREMAVGAVAGAVGTIA